MTYEKLQFTVAEGVATLTLDRPDKLNSFDRQLSLEVIDALDTCAGDASVRAVLITGSGRAFSAGQDLAEAIAPGTKIEDILTTQYNPIVRRIRALKKPVIAAVNGFALGGGLELAMSCHIRVASDNARMGLPEVSLGVIPGYGGTQRLARLVGKGKAMEMIFTAGMIKAEEALQWGLVNHVVAQDQLLAKCNELAAAIMKNSPTALAAAIRAVNAGYEPGADGMQREIEEFGKCFGTADFKEGTSAFMEKRKANFKGA